MSETKPLRADQDLCERLLASLLAFSRDEPGVTRAAYGEGEEKAHELIREAGVALGLSAQCDAAGNLFMTLKGTDDAPYWLVGSHIDTVPHGGNFDGAAGVVGALAAVSGLRSAGITLRRSVVIAVFRAEESTWFPASYIGSRAAFGILPADTLDLPRSDDKATLRDHMERCGCDPDGVARGDALLRPEHIHGFLEMHIEQGPTLERKSIPIGLVSGISGSFRYREATCFGTYAHSGAVRRSERNDAIFALAELIAELDKIWLEFDKAGRHLTITFGQVSTDPDMHAFAKVPGEVRFCIDVRSVDEAIMLAIERKLAELILRIETTRGVRFDLGARSGSTPAMMSQKLLQNVAAQAKKLGIPYETMVSGAGHDTAVVANQGVPSAMIFIRNQNGSHNPHEDMRIEDLGEAATLVAHTIANENEVACCENTDLRSTTAYSK